MRASIERRLELYQQGLLRWNAQFSLISRDQPKERAESLLAQCAAAYNALLRGLARLAPVVAQAIAEGRFVYIDVGSGAGLPGIPWRLEMEPAPPSATWFIEPRGKRAWFLGRMIRETELAQARVLPARWGEAELAPLTPAPPPVALLSVMALRVSDADLLAGWDRATAAWPPAVDLRIVIARLRPHGAAASISSRLRRELALPGDDHCCLLACEGEGSDASLLLSVHEVPARRG